MRPFLILLFAVAAGSHSALSSQAPIRLTPSGRGTSALVVMPPPGQAADSTAPVLGIRLDYGQPHLRGRTLHTDSLVPLDKVWRTGANATSSLATDLDLVVGGVNVPKGEYAMFTLPSSSGWKLILQKNTGQTIADYASAQDVARINLRSRAVAAPLESLTMWLIPATAPGNANGELRIAWGTFELATDWSVR